MTPYQIQHIELQKAYFRSKRVPQREAQVMAQRCIHSRVCRAMQQIAEVDLRVSTETDHKRLEILTYKRRLLADEIASFL